MKQQSMLHRFLLWRDFMKKLLCAVACICLVLCMALPAVAENNQALGKLMVKNFFALVAAKDWKVLEKHLSPSFQSAHSDGARDKVQEMALLKKLNLGEYKLADFKTSRKGEIFIVTYTVSVEETIRGKRTDKTPAPRLTVFHHNNKTWQLLAHANLKPLSE
jgi:hypothetical protein